MATDDAIPAHRVGSSRVPATGLPFDDSGWALFSGAADADRRAIIDVTTGNRPTGVWLDAMVLGRR